MQQGIIKAFLIINQIIEVNPQNDQTTLDMTTK